MADLSLGGIVGSIGGAVGDLFKAEGNTAAANSYSGAAQLEQQNAQLTATSTRIQAVQQARTVVQSLGTTQADVAGAGFTESGSALDLLRSSAQQGALASSLVNIQGAINENAYAAAAAADTAKAKAAKEANTAGTIGAIASIGGSLGGGTENLVSAGKTVVSGVKYIGGLLDGSTAAGSQFTTGASTVVTDGFPSSVPTGGFASLTDNAVSEGANLGGVASDTSLGLDTSGFSLGGDISAVSSAVSDAFDYVSSGLSSAAADVASSLGIDIAGSFATDVIPGIGEVAMVANLLNLIPGVKDIPLIGSVVSGISKVTDAIGNGIVNVVSDIGSAIGSLFGSVICTALYKRGLLTRQVWHGAQRYGRDIAPPHVYYAYLLWGRPVAHAIGKHRWFARAVAPIFVPWAHELAVLAGEKTAVSTPFGRFIFRVTYAASALLGRLLHKGEHYAEA